MHIGYWWERPRHRWVNNGEVGWGVVVQIGTHGQLL
jgi:hypothetical protein